MTSTVRARRGRKLPIVLSADEVRAILAQLHGTPRIMIELLYGSGLRLSELVLLRVKDIDFHNGTITVRSGKGDKDRVTLLPQRTQPGLRQHLDRVKALHERDLAAGAGVAPLPGALRRKYPNAGREWAWQFVFPLLSKGVDIRRLQELLGHKSVETTMIYTHVVLTLAPGMSSPLDEL